MKKIIIGLTLLASVSAFAEGTCTFGRVWAEKQAFVTNTKEQCIRLAADTILPVDNTSFKVVVKYGECPANSPGVCETTYKQRMKFSELQDLAQSTAH